MEYVESRHTGKTPVYRHNTGVPAKWGICMKCQQCDRPATFHITELTGPKPVELHLCEEHARQYLSETSEHPESVSTMAASLAQNIAQQLTLNQAAEELKDIDQQMCPVCGISFFDFRKKGRLGCPHDYVCFSEQLVPLITSIHGSEAHVGKAPKRCKTDDDTRTNLIRYRRELEEAIAHEEYERASQLRDKIKEMEA